MSRRAFVTGATGFIGRRLVDRLVGEEWAVRALVRSSSDTRSIRRPGVELIPGDLQDVDSIRRAAEGTEVAFHLAAVTAARTEREYGVANADGTAAVLAGIRLASDPPRRLVYLSSYAAAGPWVDGRPRTVDDVPAPLTGYGRTKLSGERYAKEAEGNGLEVIVIRAPAVYGPGDRTLLPYFRLLRAGVAPVPGGEDRTLHLVFVDDLVAALARAADAPPGTFAIADPKAHRWKDVVATIATSFDRKPFWVSLPPTLLRVAAAMTEWVGRAAGKAVPFNREKAEEMLASGWVCDLSGSEPLLPPESVTPLEEGIDRTIRWYIRQGWL